MTSEASPKNLVSNSESRRIAYHEAGHAVANDPLLTGQDVDFITVRGEGDYGGYARYKDVGQKVSLTRQSAIAEIARSLAGGVAEELMSFGTSSGRSKDLEVAKNIAIKSIAEYGLSDSILSLPVNSAGKIRIEDPRVQAEIQSMLQEGEQLARKRLLENWPAVRELTSKLLKNGHINNEEFHQAIEKSKQVLSVRVPRKLVPPVAIDCGQAYEKLFGK
jgi:cell division protease FtsH